MLLIIIAVVAFLLFITALIFSVRNWKWFHITMFFFVYVAANFMVVSTAKSLKPRKIWMDSVKKHEVILKKKRDEGMRLASGDPTEVTQTQPNLRMLQARLNRVMTRRGRVWRRLEKDGVAGNEIKLKSGADTGFNDKNLQTIVYLFREEPVAGYEKLAVDTTGQVKFNLATAYLGEFTVTAATGTSITLRPTRPLDQNMVAAYQSAPFLAIYETMPIDGHRLFSQEDSMIEALTDEQKPLFGAMDKKTLDDIFLMAVGRSFMANPKVADIPAKVTELNGNYLRDGTSPQPTDNQDRDVWYKVRFIKKPTQSEVVDSEEEQDFGTRPYDNGGRAIAATLRRGENVEFNVDDIAVFHREKAQELIDAQICELLHPIYVRPLQDYTHHFHRIRDRLFRIAQEVIRVARDVKKVDVANAHTVAQIKFREAEKTDLTTDLDLHKKDLTEIQALEMAMNDKQQKLLTELATLHARNRFLASEIAKLDRQMRDRIDSATKVEAKNGE